MLVSSSEPLALRQLGVSSDVPEQFGSDILLMVKNIGLVGVQRKEVADLVASARGDRMGKQLAQMSRLGLGVWIIEGDWQWTTNGVSLKVNGFTKKEYDGLMFSIQSRTYWIVSTSNLSETIECVSHLASWLTKDKHQSLNRRTNPQSQTWGRANSRDWGLHWWQSFEGVGVEMAGRLYDAFGIPVSWSVEIGDLMSVKGVGKKTAERILGTFG